MKKKYLLLFLIVLLFANCFSYRNKFGKKRLLYFTFISKNRSINAYQLIDTTALYKLKSVLYHKNDNYLKNFNSTYLKFYSKGKVADFFTYDSLNINSLNLKKADIGYFNYKKGIFTLHTYFYHVQGGGFVKKTLKKARNNYFYLKQKM